MPNSRLGDREALAIAEFLAGLLDREMVPQDLRYPRKTTADRANFSSVCPERQNAPHGGEAF